MAPRPATGDSRGYSAGPPDRRIRLREPRTHHRPRTNRAPRNRYPEHADAPPAFLRRGIGCASSGPSALVVGWRPGDAGDAGPHRERAAEARHEDAEHDLQDGHGHAPHFALLL